MSHKLKKEATNCSLADEWLESINDELLSHEKAGTWVIVPKPNDCEVIDSPWIFTHQEAKAGKNARFKARLCARGFLQQYGVNYTETFAPTLRYDALRVMLAMANHHNMEMIQFDVKMVFLYGELEEDVYMKIPQGVSVKNYSAVTG